MAKLKKTGKMRKVTAKNASRKAVGIKVHVKPFRIHHAAAKCEFC